MFNEGDQVSVIHNEVSGKVISVNGPKITIEDSDGFIRYYRSTELAKKVINNYNIDTAEAIKYIEDKVEIESKSMTEQKTEVKKKSVLSADDNMSNEIDLHIEVLMPEATYWLVSDILQKQMIACRSFVEKVVANHLKRIILIHGKGEGVLKNEIYSYLNRVEEQLHVSISYNDADFRTFGIGATEVNITY